MAFRLLEVDVRNAEGIEAKRLGVLTESGFDCYGLFRAQSHRAAFVRAVAQYNLVMLPTPLYLAAQVRAIDRVAIEEANIPGYQLMTRAAEFALLQLRERWPAAKTIGIACGAGNNAGDGYVLGRLAAAAGLRVRVISLVAPEKLAGDAAIAYRDFAGAGLSVESWPTKPDADLWVDALLGTGLDRPLSGDFEACVRWLNGCRKPLFALDIPTGVDADLGIVHNVAVAAEATATFVGLKLGLFLAEGRALVGALAFDDLGIPGWVYERFEAARRRLDPQQLEDALPPRDWNAHKGTHGTVVVVAGGQGMGGAARLAGEAALRSGAGLVKVVTHPEHASALAQARPELIVRAAADPNVLDEVLRTDCSCLVIGPGLGQEPWSRALFDRALAAGGTRVIDADGLNLLAQAPVPLDPDTVLTPHPREAGRLLGWTAKEVQSRRGQALDALTEKTRATVVLKGSGTLVSDPGGAPWLCAYGNPGLATAGTGDVLAGVIGGLAAQLGDPVVAARLGVLTHALAGDSAAQRGQRGLLASDLMPEIRRWVNPAGR